jgi:diguanylate cyclase (GGDEF)-like protein/PAS domain S-box-containing protein
VELNGYPLRTPDGRIDGAVFSGRDITERLAAQETTRFQATLLEAVGQAVVATDPVGTIVFWNRAAELTYGWSAEEALGRNGAELVPVESGDEAEKIFAAMNAGETWVGDFVLQRRDGSRFPALITNTPVFNVRDELVAIIGVSTDISERKRGEESARRLSAIVESTADAIFTQSVDGTILTWNRGAEQLYGHVADDVIGRSVSLLDTPEADDELQSILGAVAQGETVRALETVRRRRDGTTVDVSLTMSPIFGNDGAVVAASVIGRDITDRRRLEEELTRQAMYDALTALPNRTLLGDRLEQALAGGARRADSVAVLFVDLDQFKTVNDANGHVVGDALLVEVAQRLLTVVRSADTVARFGGDEFVIVCNETDADQANDVADRISAALAEPMEIAGQRFYVSASIGIAVTPPLEADADALLRYADAAMYDAKARGRARARVFDASLAKQSTERLELTNELREAMANDALELHYQPVIELGAGRLIGVEALTRWPHPVHGWVPPSLFVPAAEDNGLIWALDKWAIGRACRDAAALRMAGVLPWYARVAVNVSARNVAHPDLVDVVRDSAQAAGLPLDAIELELTETGLMTDAPAAREIMAALRDLGVGIALDDFGTGYSSLTYVRQLPVTTIKIDRSFIQHISDRAEDLAIAASVVDLARAIGLRVVAEGVETHEQLRLLTKLGCGNGQGYLWSPAVPTDALAELVRQNPDGFLAISPTGRTNTADATSYPRLGNEHGLHRLIEQHTQGASLATIAAALNSEGYRTPAGLRWHSTTVARALADGAYAMAEGAPTA